MRDFRSTSLLSPSKPISLKSPEDGKEGLNPPGFRGNRGPWSGKGGLGRGGYFPTLTTLAACARHQALTVVFGMSSSHQQAGEVDPPNPSPISSPGFYSCQVQIKLKVFPPFSLRGKRILQLPFLSWAKINV